MFQERVPNVYCLCSQGNTHDDVLLIATSLLRVVVKAVIMMDRSLPVVVINIALPFVVMLVAVVKMVTIELTGFRNVVLLVSR